jgi:hypothetical protein
MNSMSRKKISLIILTLLTFAIIIGGTISYRAATSGDPNNSNTDTQDSSLTYASPEGPLLVIPEAPLGIIGLFSACLLGLTLYSVRKRNAE